VEYAKTTSVITVQRNFRRQFEVDPPDKNSIKRWHMPTLNGVLSYGLGGEKVGGKRKFALTLTFEPIN
jgi:hypothetical protein